MTRQALHTAYIAWYDELLIFAISRVKNEQDAQEIVQDAFIKLLHFEGESEESQRAFLWLVTKNAAIDLLRHRQFLYRQVQFLFDEEDWRLAREDEDPRRHQLEAMVLAKLAHAMQTLPGTCRKVFFLFWVGKRTGEIMEALGISRQNVLNQKQRAIQLLRKKMLNE